MAREKKFSRTGNEGLGTRHPMEQVGKQPHHFVADRDAQTKKMSDTESMTLAKQMAKVQSEPDQVYVDADKMGPDRRTAAWSYYSQTQVAVVQWGDGGPAYAYYDVTPQEWDAVHHHDSPGRFINDVLNSKNYGKIRGN